MLSWKNTKCREQQTQSITITTPAAGEESVNRFGLLPACSPTWENTVPRRAMISSPPAPPYIHPHQKALQSTSPQGFCFGQKLSKEERGSLHRRTGLPAMSWRLRKVLDAMKGSASSKVLLTPLTLLTPPPLQSFALCVPLPLPVASLSLSVLLLSPLLSSSSQHHPSFLLPNVCQTSCAPVCTPIPSSHLSSLSPCGLPPTAGRESCAAQGPAPPGTSDPQEGET